MCDELDRYLSTDPEHVGDVLTWWHERHRAFPQLSRMAFDYLSIPGRCLINAILHSYSLY